MDAIRPHTAGSTKAAVNKSEVGTIEFPTRPDRRSDHFPGGAGISERFAAQRYRVERATMVVMGPYDAHRIRANVSSDDVR